MSYPTLTPKSKTSAIVLPATGTVETSSGVCDTASACNTAHYPVGAYTGSAQFLSGAAAQVAYTYKKLGGDILDIELTTGNVYAAYEEAVLEYSYLVNLHQSKNVLSDYLGASTGSFNHQGKIAETGHALSGSDLSLRYPRMKITYEKRVSDFMATRAGLAGDTTIYSASVSTATSKSDYDLQEIVAAAAEETDSEFYNKVSNKKITVKKVYFKTPFAMWRFFGYYGGINAVGNLSSYGMYADDSTFELIPAWHNKLQAMQFEDNIWTRVSHYSFELKNNRLRIFPTPSTISPSKIWFEFTVDEDPWDEPADSKTGTMGVNNLSTIPFENVPYENINSIGKQWIRRFALAVSKEVLGQVRSKFANIPVPGDSIILNGQALISEGREEQDKLREELKSILDELTYSKLLEKDASTLDAANSIQTKMPLPIVVG